MEQLSEGPSKPPPPEMFRSLLTWLGWERLSIIDHNTKRLLQTQDDIMAKLAGLEKRLKDIADTTNKSLAEIRGKFDELNGAIAQLVKQLEDVELPAGVDEQLTQLEALSGQLDALVPDAPSEG